MTRLDELQADDAIGGLDEAEQQELAEALRAAGLERDASWERIAAVAMVALQQGLPSGPSPQLMNALRAAAPVSQLRVSMAQRWLQPNMVLAAALLTLSVVLLWTSDSVMGRRAVAPNMLRQELMQVSDTAVWNWSGGAPKGDVVWHGPSQRGTMRFSGLPPNDPRQRQYQLWIVDGKRNAAQPVDGGVFDVPAGQSEVVIPIDPKVLVHEAKAFVVTIEVVGGVVVSDREQIVVLATPQ
ncbi:MAG: hypothetical protein ACJAYX_004028 [Planctomycetota bacterium]|jgi:hypothetical protein